MMLADFANHFCMHLYIICLLCLKIVDVLEYLCLFFPHLLPACVDHLDNGRGYSSTPKNLPRLLPVCVDRGGDGKCGYFFFTK